MGCGNSKKVDNPSVSKTSEVTPAAHAAPAPHTVPAAHAAPSNHAAPAAHTTSADHAAPAAHAPSIDHAAHAAPSDHAVPVAHAPSIEHAALAASTDHAAPAAHVASTDHATPAAEVIFFLGGPGSGKGTQCHMLAESGKYVHLSTGDLLREERKSGSKDAQLIEQYLVEGKLVPSELLLRLVRKAMQSNGWIAKRFLLDGYPRNEENIAVWDQLMKDVKVLCLLFLECREETLKARILSRNQGRSDDNLESLQKRLRVFNDETKPVLELFRKIGGKVEKVDGEGTAEEVNQHILSVLPSL